MILLTRLNGPVFALNPDLVERADCTPDTVITLVDGTKYVVTESLSDLVDRIREYRASIIAEAQHLVHQAESDTAEPHRRKARIGDLDRECDDAQNLTADNVVPLYRRER